MEVLKFMVSESALLRLDDSVTNRSLVMIDLRTTRVERAVFLSDSSWAMQQAGAFTVRKSGECSPSHSKDHVDR